MGETAERLSVLVVEDEASIRVGLCDVLRFRGFAVESAADGATAVQRVLVQRFDLVLLDVMLPQLDGFGVCTAIRARGYQMPVLMLTAKGAEEDVLRGFEVGADDYVTKPFSVRELLARVQALLKRSGKGATECFLAGPFAIDPAKSCAACDTLSVELTAREVRILRLLADEPGRIVSRRALLRDGWDMHNADHVETRTVDVHIAKLRKKLGSRGEQLIETVRGQGYRLCTTVR